jgi:phosphotriesterase-related protein
MDGKVHTVQGLLDPELMGLTYSHEHLLWSPPEPYSAQDPDLVMDDVNTAIDEVLSFSRAGGQTIVEMTTPELKRSPKELLAISKATNVNIIAATGYNKGKFCEKVIFDKDIDTLINDMLIDLQVGMDGTSICAGLIKASSSQDVMSAGEEKVFRAAARAHKQTGAPISTHTEGGTLALAQIALLINSGVKPDRILIGHLDRKLEPEYLLNIAQTGVYLGFDQIAKEKYYPDKERIEMLKILINAGFQNQILLSGDMARRSSWPAYGFGKGPGLSFILWRFIPCLIEAGVPAEVARCLLVDNPARFFAWRE